MALIPAGMGRINKRALLERLQRVGQGLRTVGLVAVGINRLVLPMGNNVIMQEMAPTARAPRKNFLAEP